MRTGSSDRTLNSRLLLLPSSCPTKARLCVCSAALRRLEEVPLFSSKVTKQDSHQPHLKPQDRVGPGTFQGPLGDCPVPESPTRRVVRQAGVGLTKLSHPGLG